MMWTAVDVLATFALAAIGFWIAIRPPDRSLPPQQARLFALLIVATGVSIVAKYFENATLETKLTGGDNYCFVNVFAPQKGQLQAQLSNDTGRIPAISFGIYRDAGNHQWTPHHDGQWFHTPCLKTTANLPVPMSLGRYRVDFMGSNFDWHQYIELREGGGKISQTVWVEDDKGKIIRPKRTSPIEGE
jgi:hypothetical protein